MCDTSASQTATSEGYFEAIDATHKEVVRWSQPSTVFLPALCDG